MRPPCTHRKYSLFMYSWMWLESGGFRNGGMLILRIYVRTSRLTVCPLRCMGKAGSQVC